MKIVYPVGRERSVSISALGFEEKEGIDLFCSLLENGNVLLIIEDATDIVAPGESDRSCIVKVGRS